MRVYKFETSKVIDILDQLHRKLLFGVTDRLDRVYSTVSTLVVDPLTMSCNVLHVAGGRVSVIVHQKQFNTCFI